jgi:hypothetical protein
MIVDARDVGNVLHHLLKQHRDIVGGHAGMQFMGFRRLVADRLHGEMQHDFVAATMGFLGNVDGMGVIGQDRDGQGIRQSKYGVGSGAVVAQIVEDNGQPRAAHLLVGLRRGRRGRVCRCWSDDVD